MARYRIKMQVILAVVLLFSLTSAVLAENPTKRALLIGIDDYKSASVSDLKGAVNDALLMRTILIGKFGVPEDNILVLTNEQATHAGIVAAIQSHLISPAAPGDVSILHYSGHGSQMRDRSGDEIDGWDETIVPYDSRTDGVFDISDDQLNGLLQELTAKTKNVTFILDSCNSGTGLRAGNAVRTIERDLRSAPPQAAYAVSQRGAGEGRDGISLADSNYVMISGSRADQLSNETLFDGNRHGVMTWFLSRALIAADEDATYQDVMDLVRRDVVNRYPSQEPQLEGKGTNLRLFGVDRIETQPYVLVSPGDANSVVVDAGRVFGVRNGSVFKIFPPNTRDFAATSPVATAEVYDAGEFSSKARLTQGLAVQPVSRALFDASLFGDGSIPVFVDDAQNELMSGIKVALASSTALTLTESEKDARVIVWKQNGDIRVSSGDLESFVPSVSALAPNAADEVVQHVKDVAHWLTVLGLQNPVSNLDVEFTLHRDGVAEGERPPDAVLNNSEIAFRVTNKSEIPVFVTVLDISSDGSIWPLYPPDLGARQALPAGQLLERRIRLFAPEDRESVIDTLKVIATTQPIDPSVFPRGPFRALPQPRSVPSDPLSRFLSDALRANTRGAHLVDVGSWVTRQRAVTIRRPATQINGFALYFNESQTVSGLENKLSGDRSLCAQADAGPGCTRVASTADDGSAFEISDRKSISPSQAFEEAYEIQEMTQATRVEPEFEVRVPGVVTDRGIEKRDVATDDLHDEFAAADHLWSLKQINVTEAWAMIRDANDLPEGLEASGIFIAHPDTGYRDHPEVWTEVNGVKPIDASKGFSFFDDNPDPIDPLLDDAWLDNPAHGTASGSVIVSPAGCQLPDRLNCVDGIARGARLIPLRVHRTVSQFSTANLRDAINAVAEGRIKGDPKLISIAMGGPPSLGLWRATKRANENGVLIIAASGNYVGTVVWPARFSSTIAVAANNVRCAPWQHSSGGTSIDISAPGESVWRATVNASKESIVGMGKGTTFATGNVSGAAALWLAFHRGTPELEELQQQGRVIDAFRAALLQSAWRPGSTNPSGSHCEDLPWNERYGPGLLDVAELLKVPLNQTRQALPVAAPELEQIPLFSSLYPYDADSEKIITDYLSLFEQSGQIDLDAIAKFETEILFHYTTDEGLRQSIEQMVATTRSEENELVSEVRMRLGELDLSRQLVQALQ